MTVSSINYASIDEVWGSPFNETKQSKKKSSKVKQPVQDTTDPICDLYESKLGDYRESDLINTADQTYPTFQRTMKPQKSSYEYDNKKMSREPAKVEYEKQFDMYLPNMYDDIDEVSVENLIPPSKPLKEEIQQQIDRKEILENTFNSNQHLQKMSTYKKEANKLDIFLFIISGIILIFLMEQFIKIGAILHSK